MSEESSKQFLAVINADSNIKAELIAAVGDKKDADAAAAVASYASGRKFDLSTAEALAIHAQLKQGGGAELSDAELDSLSGGGDWTTGGGTGSTGGTGGKRG